jgi:peptidoglycan/LPS O-acetylase OafA/YrhL
VHQSTGVLSDPPLAQVRPEQRFYLPELDGLRFYAFLGVFAVHSLPVTESVYRSAGLPLPRLCAAIVNAGGSGVDLFFVLSAFLITSLLMKEQQQRAAISLHSFYIRRIFRIWPLYFAVVLLGVFFAHTMARIGWFYDQRLSGSYLAGYLTFASNWVYALHGAPQSVCAPLWTVAIEEQFYLVWPLLMKALARRGITMVAIATLVVATIYQLLIVWQRGSRGFIFYGSASRCAPLALGVLIALYSDRLASLGRGSRRVLGTCGVALWIASCWWGWEPFGPATLGMVANRLAISAGAVAVFLACLHSRNKLVTAKWVVGLGKISYGLYMLHFTGILLAATLLRPAGRLELLGNRGLALVLTMLLAFASYRWLETPFLRAKRRFETVLSRPV